jgi:hypothetical protein
MDDAVTCFRKALARQPDYPDAGNYLQNALQMKRSTNTP